jgi:hypothetical protein
LEALVCSGGDQAIRILRGDGFQQRLQYVGISTADLIGDLTNKDSKDCPVSHALTDAAGAKIPHIKP